MNQEDKELLLKDLCSRLPYEIKGKNAAGEVVPLIRRGQADYDIITSIKIIIEKHGWRPYLFPLSSMTEEQYGDFIIVSGWDSDIEDIRRGKFSCVGSIGIDYIYDTIDWLNKNRFDYRGLIPKGLAIDASKLNIY